MRKKILRVIFIFSLVCLFLLGLIYIEAEILSGVRSYVRGEGMYAKGQKDAVISLIRFTNTLQDRDFEAYKNSLRIPMGDRIAREALSEDPPDRERAFKGFVQGQNKPSEIPSMINLFIYCKHIPFMEKAIKIWTEGDAHIAKLNELALKLKSDIDKSKNITKYLLMTFIK